VGEAGTIASTPALVNAVCDALSTLGVRHIDMPLKPENVWRAASRGRPQPGLASPGSTENSSPRRHA
jgi:carbon-monoxide dehydrogenase large subunit